MRCNLARRELATVLMALGIALHAGAAQAVKLAISSGQVSQAGAPAQLCVSLVTDGQEVAGTQNDLVWDGTCMTLNEGACAAAGGHGKQVNTRIQNSADFRMRVLVLSLSDVDPIDDGPLYCCGVQGEAPPGSCCSISVVNTGASDSKGNAVGGVGGNTGRLCTGGSSGGAVGAMNPPGSQLGQGLGDSTGGGMGDGGGGGAMAGGGGGGGGGTGAQAPPANQVLPGGGVQPPAAPAAPANQAAAPVIAVPGAPAAQAPTPIGAPTVNLPPVQAVPVTPAAALPPPTVAATAAAAAATSAPTAVATAAIAPPTAVPPTQAPPSTPTAPRATATAKSSGWFGCQIDAQASAAPALALALLFAALAYVARRSPR